MKIGGNIISTLEYPGNLSLVIFLAICPLRCPYCHNPELLRSGDEASISDIIEKIDNNLDFIDAIVISGGEPLVQGKEIKRILEYAKKKGLKTKLDTSGCYPETLEKIIHLLDYLALDIKAPFNKYKDISKVDIGEKVKKSMEIGYNSDAFLECRTTYTNKLLSHEDMIDIAKNIKCDMYKIQQFRNKVVLSKELENIENTNVDELKEIAKKIRPYQNNIKITTAEFGTEDVP